MIELHYDAGNVISPDVHQIGILALGSHLENHGPALPIDTDAKIASYLALEASFHTGAKFLGVLYAATEFSYINHGKHVSVEYLVENRLKPTLKSAKKCLDIDKVVIVNGHGGNTPVKQYIKSIQDDLDIEIIFNNKIVEIEGPHAGSGELSMGSILGILDPRRIKESCDFENYPEVGMCGFHEAREKDEGINKGAKLVESHGVDIDPILGHSLLDTAITDIIRNVESLLEEEDY